MTTFDDRERAFESKFARDSEMQFRVVALRNRLVGEWAAARMGLSGDAASAYAREVVAADFEEAGDGDVIRKLVADLGEAKVPTTEAEVQAKLSEMLKRAKELIISKID